MKKDKVPWFESGYITSIAVIFSFVAGWLWGWQAYLIVALAAWVHRLLADSDWSQRHETLDKEELWQYVEWLRQRLHVVDPSAGGVGKGGDAWVRKDYTSCLQPPPDEVVGQCRRCNHKIRRDELATRYNGGHEILD